MDAARIEEVAAALTAEQAARAGADAALSALIEGSTDSRIDRLVGIIEQQGKQIADLACTLACSCRRWRSCWARRPVHRCRMKVPSLSASTWTGSPTDERPRAGR